MQKLLLVRHDHFHPAYVHLYFPKCDFQHLDLLCSVDCHVLDFLRHDCHFDDFAPVLHDLAVRHFCAVNFRHLDDFQIVAVVLLVVRLVADFVVDSVTVDFGIAQDLAHGKTLLVRLDMPNSSPTA